MIPQEYIRCKADQLAIEQGCTWDEAEAQRIIAFVDDFIRPQFIPGKFTLLPWQRDWLRQLYGWKLPTGERRWKKAILHAPKKVGKTLLASIVCMAETFISRLPSPLVVSASTTRENASQIFAEIKHSIDHSRKLSAIAKCLPTWKLVRYERRNAQYKSISSDAGNAEGLNCSCVVLDETHAHESEKLYRSLEYSTISRAGGLLVSISTAGTSRTHFYFNLYSKAKRILSGEDLDITTFATVYELPDTYEPTDPKGWAIAVPSLGTSYTVEAFARDLQAAKANMGDWLSFLRYRLNVWTATSENQWIDGGTWDNCKRPMSDSELAGCPNWIAVDLSQVKDPTSISQCWHLGGKKYYCRSHAFVCEAGVRDREKQNLPLYNQFAAEGNMTITSGDMIDAVKVKQYILELAEKWKPISIVFDQYSAWTMAQEIAGQGLPTLRMPQSFRYFSEPCKELEAAIVSQRISHDGNNWLRWCMTSVVLDSDSYGNVRPHRDKSMTNGKHIDGAVALLMCFSQAYQAAADVPQPKSVYDDRGLFVLD